MLLAIDAGNTNIVFALFRGEALAGQWRISTDARRTADEYGVWLLTLLNHEGIPAKDVHDAILSSVVPGANFELKRLVSRYFHCNLKIVGEDVRVAMPVELDAPREIGADRLVNAFAAWQREKRALVVVDFGTATTFDVVDRKGAYIGGVIAPGVNLSLDALQKAAARLPHVGIAAPERVIGKNTVSAMQSGIYYGYIGLIEGITARIAESLGEHVKVIATGGLAALYAKSASVIDQVLPDLTLEGLQLIHHALAQEK